MISLTSRVTLAGALVLTIFIAVTALALEQAFEQNARSAMRERLFAQLYLVMASAEVDQQGRLQMPSQLGEPRLNLPGSGLVARIGDGNGETLWQSPSAVGMQLPTPSGGAEKGEQFSTRYINGIPHFVAALNIEWHTGQKKLPLLLSVAETLTPFREQMSRYRHTLWGWLGSMAVVSLLALVAALGWGLRPLRSAAAEVQAIESGEQEGLERDYPKELKHLTDNINTLLHHEHAQQARYKNALGDLAHSLKTPLAVLRGLGDSMGEHSPTLHEQVDRMDNIVQYQLQRAATAGRSALAAPIAVQPAVDRLLATLQKVYHDKGVLAERQLEARTTFRGDEGDLLELLGNLLDNAFKWSASTIRITAHANNKALVLSVEDDGPGIESHRADEVLQRGVRLDEATPGHGIGLPMVRDIVEAYGGTLAFERSDLGGVKIIIALPG